MSQWQESFLNEIVQIIGGGTPKTTVDDYWFGEIPWLSVVDFGNDNRWVSKTEKTITERGLKNSSTKLLDTGDLILSARGTVGEIAQLTKPMAFNQSCYGLKAKTPLSNNFLYYLIKYNLLKLKRNTHGSVFSTITRETFKNIDVKYPENKNERKTIERTLTSLDLKIHNLQRQNQTLEKIAQTLFKQWFMDFNFPDENGNPYKDSGGEMVASELGEIPLNWSTGNLGKIASFKNGKTSPERSEKSKIPVYGSNGIIGKIEDHNFEHIIIIGRVGSYCGSLYYCMEKCWVTDNAMVGKLKKHTSHIFLYQTLIANRLNKRSGGSGQPLLNQTILKDIEIVLPPEQKIELFENWAVKFFKNVSNNQRQIQTLTQTRDTLLSKLMSGQIRIKD